MKSIRNGTFVLLMGFSLCFSQERSVPVQVDEIGAYYLDNGKWLDIPPEVVNWKTGGALKHLASVGLIHGDVNGRIRRPASKTKLTVSMDLLVYTPEGTAISEYQLIRLHPHSDSREFRVVTGGIFHASGGADRDTLDFESQRVSRRTFRVVLGAMEPGEYGLLPPGLSLSNSASAQFGKMFTFSISTTKPQNARPQNARPASTNTGLPASAIRETFERQKTPSR